MKGRGVTAMKYTLGQASKETGVSKPTLSRAIKNGDLSASGGGGKSYKIDASELGRWLEGYRQRNPKVVAPVTPHETPETPETSSGNSVLQAKLEIMEQRFSDAEKTIQDLRTRLDVESEERRTLTRQITDQRQIAPEPQRRGWWARFME